VVGIITDQDVIARGVAEGRDHTATTVGEIMTTDVLSCAPDTEIREAARLMQEKQTRRLLVLDGDRLAGIVSVSDVPTEYVVS
jgi:CBS domain-containing protein